MKRKMKKVPIRNSSTKTKNEPVESKASIMLSSNLTLSNDKEGLAEFTFSGYSGDSVDLSDYGIDYPMVYDIAGIKHSDKVPILSEHWIPIGHSTSITKTETNLSGVGLGSYPSEERDRVVTAMRNGFPMQASMGLGSDVFNKIEFYEAGKSVVVNGRTFHGPILVAREATLVEMTATMSGRDPNTNFSVKNKEHIEVLKNSYKKQPIKNSTPTEGKPEDGKKPEEGQEPKTTSDSNTSGVDGTGADNSATTNDAKAATTSPENKSGTDNSRLGILINSLYTRYADQADTIDTMVKNGASFDAIKDKLELNAIKNSNPSMPKMRQHSKQKDGLDNSILANFALSVGVAPETLEAQGLDKKTIDNANDGHRWTFVETLVNIANSAGGNYTGFSDVEVMCKYLKNNCTGRAVQNSGGFSSFDMPNLFERVTTFILEERLKMQKPFAATMCKEESNKDFREEQHIKVNGGEIWQKISNKGRIPHTYFGEESQYTNKIETIAQIVTFDRETIVNDSMSIISEMLEAMVEGALIHPDMQLLQLMTKAASAAGFYVNNGNSFTGPGAVLNHANLGRLLLNVKKYNLNKGDKYVKQMLDDRWTLVTSPDLEATAWEILNQQYLVSNNTVNGPVGVKNFYYGKVDQKTFMQLGNESLAPSGTFNTTNFWCLWPKNTKYAPYTINYLRGRKKPTIENVELPGDMLGFGVRGYWEATVNERDPEFITRAVFTAEDLEPAEEE